MTGWGSTARRDGGGGLAYLWSRTEWRESEHGESIRTALRDMLSDSDWVQRFHAARVVSSLEPDEPAALELISERLGEETHPHVTAALIVRLSGFAARYPGEVDRIVAKSSEREPLATVLGNTPHDDSRETADPFVELVLWLAIRMRTAHATSMAEGWFATPHNTEAGRRCMWLVRGWMSLPPTRADERRRAFELARSAAGALQKAIESTDEEVLKAVYQSVDALSNAVYFASGAFGDKGQDPSPPHDGFAVEAFDLLSSLTAFRHPSVVHHLVQTAAHLAPEDPARAFSVVHQAVRPNEPYSYDPLAADTAVSIIKRYFADFRETVVGDPLLLTQVRTVLDAFVGVGWPTAVSLSYDLGLAFR